MQSWKGVSIKTIVSEPEWQKLRKSFLGTWKKEPEENVKKLRVRKNRISFEKRWKDSLKDANKKNKKVIDSGKINGEIYTLSYLRANLFRLYFYNMRLVDVPFGFVFCAYHKLFKHSKNIYEDSGLTEKLYDRAVTLFLEED